MTAQRSAAVPVRRAALTRPEQRRPTVLDVARAAGVSPSTVSRALHDRGYASAQVRALVVETARRIGYVADANARNLRARTSDAVGVLISDLRNAYYADLAAGIEDELGGSDWHMVLVNDDGSPAKGQAAVRTFSSMRVAGAIVTPVNELVVRGLRAQGLQVVCADRRAGRLRTDLVMADDEAGARELTQHLLQRGHRRIAMVLDERRWSTGAGRLAGYQAALRQAGVAPDEALLRMTSWDAAAAAATTRALLTAQPEVTAVVAVNNVVARGAVDAARLAGRRIGDDLALAAFDDVPWMALVQPGITTMDQRPFEIGRRAAALLRERLAGAAGGPARRELVRPRLIPRGSTGPA
jgi:LacI family transcriptional regulator